MKTCRLCELPIKPDDLQPSCADGVHFHRICFDLGVVSLEADLTAFVRRPDSVYEELPNGKFRVKAAQ